MKKLLIATAAAVTLSTTTAIAADLSYGAYAEYAVEAQAFELGLGAAYAINDFTLTAELVALKPNDARLDLDSVDLGVSYAISTATSLYGEVTLDSDLQYSETVLGVAFNF